MACRLVGAKSLTEPMLEYCWLEPQEQSSVNFKSNTALPFLLDLSLNNGYEAYFQFGDDIEMKYT